MPLGDGAMIEVAEARTLVARYVPAAERVTFDALADDDVAIYLRQFQGIIDAGLWRGAVLEHDQPFSFPRIDYSSNVRRQNEAGWAGRYGEILGDDENGVTIPPLAIRELLALGAWSIVERPDLWTRYETRVSGVTAHGAGGISESLAALPSDRIYEALRLVPVAGAKVEPYRWRGGSVV